MNLLIDNNVIIDYYDEIRSKKYPESIEVIEKISNTYNLFISASSIDNLEFVKKQKLKEKLGYVNKKILKKYIEDILSKFKIAKTPSYIEIDYEDIEDSQIIASARAVDAKVITRDEGMLAKYPDDTMTPLDYLEGKGRRAKGEGGDKNSTSSTFYLQPSASKIDFANLKKQYFLYQPELEKEMDTVLNNASYIMGDAVRELEENLQKFTGARHAISCGSGTDALLLAMMALDIGPGDEVITTPFTFIASAETIAFLGAKPVFVDIEEETYNIDPSKIEAAITDKTKAIIPVSLYGQPADMDAIQAVVDKEEGRRQKAEGAEIQKAGETNPSPFSLHSSPSKIKIIIDGAQSFGSTYKGKTDSNLGDISTTSFFPAKPLGCFGDGGAVFTNDDALAEKMKSLRVHGQSKRYHHKYIGMGGRMDTLQCAVVNVKLKYYEKDLALRQEVASKYTEGLKKENIILPFVEEENTSAWAQYSIRVQNRDKVQAKLKEQGIPTAVHYPMPLHLQECFAYLGQGKGEFPICEQVSNEIMSLPMNPYLTDEEIEYIANNVIEYLG